jgi:uncharacterized protein YdeI (YjbR/CyaY-like superfamily)
MELPSRRNAEVDARIRRSERWPRELAALRAVLLGCGLEEELKWGKPCYCSEGANIVILQQLKGFVALMFFKGALLADPAGVLEEQGPNSRSARRLRVASVDDVDRLADTIRAYVREAVAVEVAGLAVGPPPALVLVSELQRRLEADPALRDAFAALTAGRQREYNLAIAQAKQAATREARIDRYADAIRAGKGLRDR